MFVICKFVGNQRIIVLSMADGNVSADLNSMFILHLQATHADKTIGSISDFGSYK